MKTLVNDKYSGKAHQAKTKHVHQSCSSINAANIQEERNKNSPKNNTYYSCTPAHTQTHNSLDGTNPYFDLMLRTYRIHYRRIEAIIMENKFVKLPLNAMFQIRKTFTISKRIIYTVDFELVFNCVQQFRSRPNR